MKNRLLKSLLIGFIVINIPPVYAQGGEWTKCIAQLNDTKYNIVHGDWSGEFCWALAYRCTGDPEVVAEYFPNPVVIKSPYQRCTDYWVVHNEEYPGDNPQHAFCLVNCRMNAAQCYQDCVNSSNDMDFESCTNKCDNDWGNCEDDEFGHVKRGDPGCWNNGGTRRDSED